MTGDVIHDKISIFFNKKGHHAQHAIGGTHFAKSTSEGKSVTPSAFASLTYFYSKNKSYKDAVILHEIQNDNIEYLFSKN